MEESFGITQDRGQDIDSNNQNDTSVLAEPFPPLSSENKRSETKATVGRQSTTDLPLGTWYEPTHMQLHKVRRDDTGVKADSSPPNVREAKREDGDEKGSPTALGWIRRGYLIPIDPVREEGIHTGQPTPVFLKTRT